MLPHAKMKARSDNGELLFLTEAVHFVSILFTPGYLLLLRNSPCRFTHKILVKVLRNAPSISHPVYVVDRERVCMQCCFAYTHVQQKLLELFNLPTKLWIASLRSQRRQLHKVESDEITFYDGELLELSNFSFI